jgi:hypothetical protein
VIQCGKLTLPTTTISNRVANSGSVGVNDFNITVAMALNFLHAAGYSIPDISNFEEEQEASKYEGPSVFLASTVLDIQVPLGTLMGCIRSDDPDIPVKPVTSK